jgi:hypothetical protein
MNTYAECQEMIATARSRADGKPIGNNTRLEDRGNCFAVRLHGTDVVSFHPDGSIVLDSGGWQTVTTKDRMNKYLPAGWRVNQERGTWYLCHGHWNREDFREWLFEDGIKIGPRGGCSGKRREKKADRKLQAKRRKVSAYTKAFCEALKAGEVPQPSAGDCWHCAMKVSGGEDDGKSLGEAVKDPGHIKSHLAEKYYVPSLALNACKAFGVSNVALGWLNSCFAKDVDAIKEWGSLAEVAEEQVKKAIRRWCLRQLGLPA